jgi:primosomal protein N''
MELNVLVEAKKEYLGQLCLLMCPLMIQAFQNMFKEAEKLVKGKRTLLQFQKLLKEVPNWNDHLAKQNSDEICNTCSWFSDLLAAVFVSFVKILSSVRLKSDNKKISIKLPTNELFVHTCYINAARELYRDPYIFDEEMNEHERDAKLSTRFSICIEASIKELLPIQQILENYMRQEGNQNVELNNEEPIEDAEDPEINDDPEPEPAPPSEEPGAGPEATAEAAAETETEAGAGAPVEGAPIQEEIKEIPIKGGAPVGGGDDDGVLFPGARES